MVPGVIGYIPEYRGVTGTPSGVIGPHGPKWWKRRGGQGAAAPPSPNWTRRGAAPPLSFPPLSPSLSSPTPTWKGGVLLPVEVGLLMGRA